MSNETNTVTDGDITVSANDTEENLKTLITVDKSADDGKVKEDEDADRQHAGEEEDESATSEDDSGSEEDESEEAEESKPKKKGGWQRRVDKLSREKAELEKQAEHWRNVALGPAKVEKTEPEAGKKPVVDADQPKIDDFEEYADYLEALTEYRVEKRFKAQEQKSHEEEVRKQAEAINVKWKERVESASKRYSDWDQAKNTDLPLTVITRQVLMDSEVGPDMMYWMVKNPEAARKIMESPPVLQAKELGKLEDKIMAKVKLPSDGKDKTPVSKAPKPISSGVGGSRGNSSTVSPDEMSYDDYKVYREKQLKAAGKSIR